MSISSVYNPAETEDKWYSYWMENKFFKSVPDEREPFTIVIPPPNVTGVLHMGHMLNNTIQDVLVRRARMLGKNACWVPGTDHASIATEAKVVNLLKEKGVSKQDIGREEFMKHAWEWKEKHGGIILEQLKKLGASCDWDRTRFTMEDDLSDAVLDVFVDLFNKGLIYRGVRMINWDPKAKTALSDEEVVHKEVKSKLYFVRYQIEGKENEFVTIATTRPETILGDTAVCVHPDDERYKKFHGKNVIVPLVNRSVPIIVDDYVEMEFGTGALKVTPAHDINDYELGIRHNLKVIDIFNDDGTLNESAELFVGKDRFAVRKLSVESLEKTGHLVKVEEIENKIGRSERTDAVIEPKLSLQWFCDMKKLAEPALDMVVSGEVKFHPKKFVNTYKHWMENVKDWCVSRQLWWGQRIPAYYYGDGPNDYVVTRDGELAKKMASEKSGIPLNEITLRQEEDVVDTWFSSWLWPISVFDGFKNPENPDINYYYPTNDLVTAPEIMFFWVARMIIAGVEYRKMKPFTNVYFTGIVRDSQRRKMSKSLGNSPDPVELMKKYGADGVRVGMLLSSPAGNDLLFDEALCEQGRNFTNKLWNAFRLVSSWEVEDSSEEPEVSKIAAHWFENRFQDELKLIEHNYEQFRISDVLMSSYRLVWEDFCSTYLEMIKPEYQKPIDSITQKKSILFLENLLKVLHPFVPFITEEIWSHLGARDKNSRLINATWPETKTVNQTVLSDQKVCLEVVSGIRTFRKKHNIPNKDHIEVVYVAENQKVNHDFDAVVCKLTGTKALDYSPSRPVNNYSFMVGSNEYFIELNEVFIDKEAELQKLQQELEYTKGFLNSVTKKLSNERFVNNAPEQVVDMEMQKKRDAEDKIRVLEDKIETSQ